MPVAKNALKAFDPKKLVISHSDYSGKTPAQARAAIVKLLENYNVVITTEKIDKERIQGILGEDATIPDYIQSSGQMEGVSLVRAFYDGTANTGAIKAGKPVVMDTVKGNAVTGINAAWQANEYKIVGVALADYATINVTDRRVQVHLAPPAAASATDMAIFLTKAKSGQSYPSTPANRRVWPALKLANPSWSGSGGDVTGSTTTEEDIYNITPSARYLPEFVQLIGWRLNEKWYCEFIPYPILQATLTEDLLLSAEGLYASVSIPGTTVLAPGEKAKSIGNVRAGYKYPSGARVLLGLLGNEYCVIKCFTCPLPQ